RTAPAASRPAAAECTTGTGRATAAGRAASAPSPGRGAGGSVCIGRARAAPFVDRPASGSGQDPTRHRPSRAPAAAASGRQGRRPRPWDRLAGDWGRAGTSRDLDGVFTALTYQSLAVFDEDREPGGSLLSELAPGGRDLVDGLVAGGPMLLILDECHHLLEVW